MTTRRRKPATTERPTRLVSHKPSVKVQQVLPRFLRATPARVFLGGRQVLEDCEAANWIAPKHRAHKLTLFSLSDLHDCANRIEAGEYPAR